jgi:hypothetical protein
MCCQTKQFYRQCKFACHRIDSPGRNYIQEMLFKYFKLYLLNVILFCFNIESSRSSSFQLNSEPLFQNSIMDNKYDKRGIAGIADYLYAATCLLVLFCYIYILEDCGMLVKDVIVLLQDVIVLVKAISILVKAVNVLGKFRSLLVKALRVFKNSWEG